MTATFEYAGASKARAGGARAVLLAELRVVTTGLDRTTPTGITGDQGTTLELRKWRCCRSAPIILTVGWKE
jgi:hypothetical protein